MSFTLIGKRLSASDGEFAVRTYHCTYLSPIFALIGLKTDGYLTVTNKRVVYYAEGSSLFGFAGDSKLYKEVSIADISHLSLGKGTRFSFLRLICGLAFGQIPAVAVTFLLSILMTFMRGGGDNPYLFRFGIFMQLAIAVLFVYQSASIPRERITRLMLAASGLSLVISIPKLGSQYAGAFQSMPHVHKFIMLVSGVPLIAYWLWCLYWFIRRDFLTMEIASKGGMATPIRVAGYSWWGRINIAANLASGMAAAVDADKMFRELGAVIADIQTLGDHGVSKWMQSATGTEDKETESSTATTRQAPLRYALTAVLLIGVLFGGESIAYAIRMNNAELARAEKARTDALLRTEAEQLSRAMDAREEFTNAMNTVLADKSFGELTPIMRSEMEQEGMAGKTAFELKQYEQATRHWQNAVSNYIRMTNTAFAMKAAATLQSQYDSVVLKTYIQETASERLSGGYIMTEFISQMNQNPASNDNWKAVGIGVDKARLNLAQNDWDSAVLAWEYASDRLTPAIQLMRSDLWVNLAENAVNAGDFRLAYDFSTRALAEFDAHPSAEQIKDLAWNAMQYDKLFYDATTSRTVNASTIPELTSLLDLRGGSDWRGIKNSINNAKALANQAEWTKSSAEWKAARGKLPMVIRSMQKIKSESDLAEQIETIEKEARRGNWAAVSHQAGVVLSNHGNHARAKELKEKADSIQGAINSEHAYQQKLSTALLNELNSGHIKAGDMTDFNAYMDRYGFEEWAQVKETVDRAIKFRAEEQGQKSSNEWATAFNQLSSAIQRVRAEKWVEKAELEAKTNNWAKVLVYAVSALKEKPDHGRARQLRDKADGFEEIKSLRSRYENLLQDAASVDVSTTQLTESDHQALLTDLAKYGGASWTSITENITKATDLEAQDKLADAIVLWKSIIDEFPDVFRLSRAQYWLEKAESDAKELLWGKVGIEAEKALSYDPDNERAMELMSEAEKNAK